MKKKTLLIAALATLVPTGLALAAPAAAPAAVTVASYNFNTTATTATSIPEQTGRGVALRVRSADGGRVGFVPRGTGKAVQFPARCSTGATTCPRVVLEGADDPDLDPGTRSFRFGAWIRSTAAQAGASANVMQKGVAGTGSQWKLQVGGPNGRATCVAVGRGSAQTYIAKSSIRVTDGAWHHLSCRRIGTTLWIYVDQVARGSVVVPSNLSISNTLPLRLGGQNLSDRTDHFGGAMDDAFVVLM